MRRLVLAFLLLVLSAVPVAAQVVAQGAPAPTSDARAWPFKIVFGGVQVDPRDVTDNANRLLGKVTFSSAQPVTQSGAWSFSFTAPQHVIIDSASLGTVAVSGPLTDTELRAAPVAVEAGLGGLEVTGTVIVQGATAFGAATTLRVDADGALEVLGPLTDTELRASAVPVSAAALPLPTGAATEGTLSTLNGKVTAVNTGAVTISSALPAGTNAIGKLAANSGVDIGDVTIDNGAGAAAVNVQDGGNTLTVDGTVTITDGSGAVNVIVDSSALPSGAATATLQGVTDADDASIAAGQTVALSGGLSMVYDGSVWRRQTIGSAGTAAAQVTTVQGIASMTPVQVSQATAANLNATVGNGAGASAVNIQDGGNTITVDGTVAVQNAALLNLHVDGAAASGAAKAGAPVQIGGVFNTTQPTVTNGQAVEAQMTARGAQIVAPGVDGFTVTANAGTNLNTSALALESGGNLAASATSLSVLDDWDESDRSKVNIIVGQAGIAAGTGVDGVTVPRVSLATNVPLPAGTNAIGKLAANSGVDIGDVDVASVAGNVTVVQGTGTNLHVVCDSGCSGGTTDTDDASIAVGQTTGLSLSLGQVYDGSVWRRVTIGSAGTASAQVTTVQGIASMTPVQVSQATGTNLHTVIDSGTLTAVTSISNALPAGNNNIGDVDVATLPALSAGTALIGKVGIDQTTPGTTNRVDVGVFPDNEPVDVARFGGSAVATGTGASGAGVPRVTVANDSSIIVGTFPDNEPINVNQIAGTGISTGVGASGTGTQRTAALIHDGTDTAQVSTVASGSLQVDCQSGCASSPNQNIVTIGYNESVAAPTAATWYIRRQWALPAGAHAIPQRAYASVTTAASRTMIAVINSLGTFNTGTNVFAAVNSVASPFFYGRLFGCVTTTLSAAADNLTVTYTDELGNSQSAAAVTFAASSPAGNCFEIPLAAGVPASTLDTGARAVTNVTDSAATTGVVTIYGMNPLIDTVGPAATLDSVPLGFGELNANEQLAILQIQAATTAQQRSAGVVISLR